MLIFILKFSCGQKKTQSCWDWNQMRFCFSIQWQQHQAFTFLSFSRYCLFLFMALVSSWLQFLRKFMEQWSWYQDLWHSPLLILSCNKNRLFISSLCFMSQPFFLFCWDFASHPWLPSCLNSLLWWTKCHIYKSFCLNSSTVSVDLTLRSSTWALRASRYLTSLMYKMWPYPRQLCICRQWNKAVSSPNLTKPAELLPSLLSSNFTYFQSGGFLFLKKDQMLYKRCFKGY